jgi:hypothetical protein
MATTLAGETTKVRHLLDQTDNTDTQFDDTNFIAVALNAGRRALARILPQEMIPGLKTIDNLSLANGFSGFSSNFFRHVIDGEQLIDSVQAREIPPGERWRLKFLSNNDLVKGGANDKYYFWHRTGVQCYPTDAVTFTIQYIKKPTDLAAGDNVELPEDISDMAVEYAFERCMGSQRGDTELALYIAKKRGIYLKEVNP